MATDHPVPLARFSPAIRPIDLGRAAISAAARVPEPVCVPLLLSEASLPAETKRAAAATARSLIEQLRTKKARGGVQALVQEYSLSSQEGVALMCLAEALLRIPDRSEEHTSELQSLMRISYAVFCLKKKTQYNH